MPAKPPRSLDPIAPPKPDKEARRSRASGRVTLSDVANAAGVSPITVSRALRGERRVDPALVDKVREMADRMGYVPDPAARALASQKSTQVLVLIPMLSNTLFVDLLEAAHKVLFAAGHHMLIGVTHYDSAEEEQVLRAYLPMRPAGLLLTGFDRSPGAAQLLASSTIPAVHLMELHDKTAQPDSVYSVGFSQTDAGATITQHLLDQGYRRIAFCGAQLDARVLQRHRPAATGAEHGPYPLGQEPQLHLATIGHSQGQQHKAGEADKDEAQVSQHVTPLRLFRGRAATTPRY